jgi:hypothetical protein
VTYSDADNEVGVYASDEKTADETEEVDKCVQVYKPLDDEEDAPYPSEEDLVEYESSIICEKDVTKDTTAWWTLACGRVLGLFKGMLLEYDPSTLAPLGLVVGADELIGKSVAIIDVETDSDSDTANETPLQAVVLIDEENGKVVVVQPNDDGSYWRKIVRNKLVRMREMRREEAAAEFAEEMLKQEIDDVVSTWGPYTSTSGTAKETGVDGLTV